MTTDNHEYNTPAKGTEDWDVPLNENVEQFDTDVEIRDEFSNRDQYTPTDGGKFISTDYGIVYLADDGEWQNAFILPRYTNQSSVVTGFLNSVDPGVRDATIAGGTGNDAKGRWSTVGGGMNNTVHGRANAIGGGEKNETRGRATTIGGGWANVARGAQSTIGGGYLNETEASFATVGGGGPSASPNSENNNRVNDDWGTIAGGGGNIAGRSDDEDGTFATVGGGKDNRALGRGSTVAGGVDNWALGDYSFAGGRNARAVHDGSFVWSDDDPTTLSSTGEDQFLIGASGGTGIGIRKPEAKLHVAGRPRSPDGVAAYEPVAIVENRNQEFSQILELRTTKTSFVDDVTEGLPDFITFNSPGERMGKIEARPNGGVRFESEPADYAEFLPQLDSVETLSEGDIVGVFAGKITKRIDGADQVMVVSDGGIVAGNSPAEDDPADFETVAFVGQVRTKVRDPVESGDLVVPSGRADGTGIAVSPEAWDPDEHGPVVGQAWETDAGDGVRRVTVAVGLDRLDAVASRLRTERDRTAELEARLEAQAADIEAVESRLDVLETGPETALADGGEPVEGDPP